jgi:hypothetical protein
MSTDNEYDISINTDENSSEVNDSCEDFVDSDSYDVNNDTNDSPNDKVDCVDNNMCCKCLQYECTFNSKYCISCIDNECNMCKSDKLPSDPVCEKCGKNSVEPLKKLAKDISDTSNIDNINPTQLIIYFKDLLEFNKYYDILGKTIKKELTTFLKLDKNDDRYTNLANIHKASLCQTFLKVKNNESLTKLLRFFFDNCCIKKEKYILDYYNIKKILSKLLAKHIDVSSPDTIHNNDYNFDFNKMRHDYKSIHAKKQIKFVHHNKHNYQNKHDDIYNSNINIHNLPVNNLQNNKINTDLDCIKYIQINNIVPIQYSNNDIYVTNILNKTIPVVEYLLSKHEYLTEEGVFIFNSIVMSKEENLYTIYKNIFTDIFSKTDINIFTETFHSTHLGINTNNYFNNIFFIFT